MTVAVPLVVVKTDASQSRREVGGRLEGGQEVVVQLEPVEASQGGEGGGGHFRYLALGEVQALEVLTNTRLSLAPERSSQSGLTFRLWKVSCSTRRIGFPFKERVIRYLQSFRASCSGDIAKPSSG